MQASLAGTELNRLRWRCRRGMLENDLLIERIFSRSEPVTQAESSGLYALMELADNDLLDLFLGRTLPEGPLDRDDVRHVLGLVRPPCSSPSSRTSP